MIRVALLTVLAGTSAAFADEIHLKLVPKGGSSKVGYYAPQRATLTAEKPATVKTAPADLSSPMYGKFETGSGTEFILDEPDGKPARLFVDTNRNGDFTDDEKIDWKGKESKSGDTATTMYSGAAMVDISSDKTPLLVNLSMYRFDKNDPSRAGLKTVLLYYRDYAYEGQITLGDKSYRAVLSDENARGNFQPKPADESPDETKPNSKADASGINLLIDVNANGKFDSRGESFDIAKPFNIGGTSWQVKDMAKDGSSFNIAKSATAVEEIPTPPDHSTGKPIMAFSIKDTEGKTVNFPGDYKGKVVLLDFWATWCGPCMKEMPNVVTAYGKHHANGFEILGISLDSEQSVSKMPAVMEKANMNWRQVADGKYWQAEIAQKYAINSIPATFLVDGDTGNIIGANLRGEALDKAVEKALSEKAKK